MRTQPRLPVLALVVLVLAAWTVFDWTGARLPDVGQLLAGAGSALAATVSTATRSPALARAIPASPTPSASPASSTSADPRLAAIQAVIQRANQEQQDAFARQNPSLMQDTATSSYYQQLVQINQDLKSGGVTAIKLVKLEWGPFSLANSSTARVTTFETWQTTYDDGSTDQSRDRNVYTLVQVQGSWKIQADDHPDDPGANVGGPGPATTSPAGPGPGAPPGPIPPISSLLPGSADVSRNWSGYAATGGTYTAVSGTWTVPQSQGSGATAGSSPGGRNIATGATWVGIGGVQSRDLIQAGTEETAVGSGRVRYDAWIETLPRPSHPVTLAVSPGDSVTVSIAQQGGDTWQIAFKDNTTGQTYQTAVQYQSSLSSAEWIEEAPSAGRGILPLDNFGTIRFSGGSTVKNGQTDTLSQAGARAITMIDARRNPIATPSALTSDGAGFTITRSTSSSSSSSSPSSPLPVFPGRRGSRAFPGLPGFSSRSVDPLG